VIIGLLWAAQSSLKEEFAVGNLEMPFGEPSLMQFANIGGSLKTSDELDLMLGCIDHETEVQDDRLVTPPIGAKLVSRHCVYGLRKKTFVNQSLFD